MELLEEASTGRGIGVGAGVGGSGCVIVVLVAAVLLAFAKTRPAGTRSGSTPQRTSQQQNPRRGTLAVGRVEVENTTRESIRVFSNEYRNASGEWVRVKDTFGLRLGTRESGELLIGNQAIRAAEVRATVELGRKQRRFQTKSGEVRDGVLLIRIRTRDLP